MNVLRQARRLFSSEAVIPELRAGHDRVFRLALALRGATVVVLGATMLVLSRDRGVLVIISAVTLFVGLPVTWLMSKRYRMVPPARMLADAVLIGVYAAIEPEARPLCMFIALAIISYASITLRRPSALALTVVASVSMAAAIAFRHDGNWVLSGIAFPLAAFAIALPAISIAHSLSQARSSIATILDEFGVVLWETPANSVVPTHMIGDTLRTRGHSPEFLLGPGNWRALLHPDDLDLHDAEQLAILAGRPHRWRYRQRGADDTYIWIESSARPLFDQNGANTGTRVLSIDITDQVRGSNRIAELDGIVDRLTNPLTILELLDLDDPLSLTYIYTNPASDEHYDFETRVGLTLAEVTPSAFDTVEHRGIGYRLSDAARTGTAFTVSDAHLTDPDGSERVACLHITPLPGNKIAIMTEDMTDLYAAQAELERQVYVDELTGLVRRVRLRDALVDAPVGSLVAVLDLDQFKEINDAFGHELGDELLVEVAKLLVETSENCMVARFGGDEFGFLLSPGDTTAEELGGRICAALSRPVILPSGLTLQTSGSVGITVKARPQTSADELFRQADVAMYRAKRAHSGYEVYAVADDTSAPHRMMLLGEVRRAIRNSELVLYYQPIVDCSSGAIVRLEGLLRWNHPTLGLLPPADFVELTELSNLNTDVVLHVLEIAITDLERWTLAGHPMPISINVAGTTLHDARLMDSIIGRIERAQLPVHLLGIELAERQLLLGSGHSVSSLQRLTAAGVWLSIDDFGTGTSSLASLRHIPAHELKIDKSFVDDLRTGDSALIGTIVAMAHQLGLEVVAEGVEDEVTWRWLRAQGADNAQGYYFARPAPVAEIEVLLAAKAPLKGNGPTSAGRMRPTDGNPLQSVANAST